VQQLQQQQKHQQQISSNKRNINELLAYYLKNAPKLFIENKKRVDKMLLMRGKSVLNVRRAVSQLNESHIES
jgi:hypothetical protein